MTLDSKHALDRYIQRVYSIGLSPYKQSLRQQKLFRMERILDVGCGPGQWTFAAAELNRSASIIGLDTERYLLDYARGFANGHQIDNCRFIFDTYENLSYLFGANSFDLIMCNSVLQYIDESKAMRIFSSLLKRRGILLMHWNHSFGYYFSRFISHVLNRDFKQSVYPLRVLLVAPLRRLSLGEVSPDHFVTFGRVRRLAAKEGVLLTRIKVEPSLDYHDGIWGIPKVFSCKGIKA
jgi:ubiquinone/menaquinone biosynthesis C-methylase UbiE